MSIKPVRGLLGAAGALTLAAAVAGCVATPPAAPYAQVGLPYYPPSFGVPPGPASAPAPAPVAGRFVAGRLVAIRPLHLRAGPSVRAPILATLPPGTPVQPLAGRAGNWQRVRTGYGDGWVYGRYLAPG